MIIFASINFENSPKDKQELSIDENLFKKVGNDDMEALGKLYDQTERVMYAYILTLAKNHDDTLDILQDTYLKIKSAAHLYKPMGKPLAWMFTIAKNLYLEKIRKEKRVVDLKDEYIENSINLSFVSDPEDRMVLETALEVISDEEREIVMMFAVGGMKHKEIARNLDLPLSTELSKYHRALKKLKVHLERRGF
ncbi:MAG: RNA polymerase sigma factor [Tissierellales bacterium]|jgi:RNA polymerase sigma-70 factor (ECF subfamily)|nr:RNA polymerase sigma factor [Tissierellales bacterium]